MFYLCPYFAGGMGGENEQLSSSFSSLSSLSSLSLSLLSFVTPALCFHFLISFSLCLSDMLDYITIVVIPIGEGALLPRLPRQPVLSSN